MLAALEAMRAAVAALPMTGTTATRDMAAFFQSPSAAYQTPLTMSQASPITGTMPTTSRTVWPMLEMVL